MRPLFDHRFLTLMRATPIAPPLCSPRRAAAVAATVIAVAAMLIIAPVFARAAAGDLDPTFSHDGKAILSQVNAVPGGVLVQPDGRIVLAGSTAREEAGVWRLNPDGTPDRGFDGDGAAVVDFDEGVYASAAALQPDGRILVAGGDGEIARFDGDGSLDETFDPGGPEGDGKKVIETGIGAVVVQRDGKIALPGAYPVAGAASDFTIVRLRPDGSLDGTDFERADFGGEDHPGAATQGPDGTIVVVGTSIAGGAIARVIAVARYNSDGRLDKTFAQTGKTTLGPGSPTSVLVQPDGRILVVSRSALGDPFITRLTSDGRRDLTFGDAGTAAGGFAGEPAATDIAAALRPDGTIFVAGSEVYGAALAVGRLSPGGALDTGFGSGGSTSIAFGLASVGAAAALQPDGKLVVAGATQVGIGVNLAVARLLGDPPALPDGSKDPGPGQQPLTPRCAGRRATIVGTGGRDTLRGTRRADVIAAVGGDDRVLARGGNDLVCGGAGNDRLSGGPGRDRLVGGAGRDRCAGDAGRDRARQCERRRSL
jgi:uncharacterized delta-60 repeat protein